MFLVDLELWCSLSELSQPLLKVFLLEKLRIPDVFQAAIRIHMNSACSVIIWRFIGPELMAFEGGLSSAAARVRRNGDGDAEIVSVCGAWPPLGGLLGAKGWHMV